jgi:hypothetical protein
MHFATDLNDSFISVVEFVVFPARSASAYMHVSDRIDISDSKSRQRTGEDQSELIVITNDISDSKSCFNAARSWEFEYISRDWSESRSFPNQVTRLIVTDNIHVSESMQKTANDDLARRSLGFEESHAGGILSGLGDTCGFPDQTDSLFGTDFDRLFSKLLQGTDNVASDSSFASRLLSSQVFSESEGRESNDARGPATVSAPSTQIWLSMPVVSQLVFIDSALLRGPFCQSQSQGSLDAPVFSESDSVYSETADGACFSVYASQRVFADSEVIRGSWPGRRSLCLTSVGFARSESLCESQAQGSREFLSHLHCSRFDRDSVDLARSFGLFDESSYRSATDVGTRSARFGISFPAASFGLAFDSQVIIGTATEIPSLSLTSVGLPTSRFPILVLPLVDASMAGAVDADAGKSAEVKTVWISLGVIFAVLLVVGAIVLVVLVVHRRRASLAPTDETETDDAIPVDGESSLNDLRSFVSGENALSHDRGFSNPKLENDIGESFDSKVEGHPDFAPE